MRKNLSVQGVKWRCSAQSVGRGSRSGSGKCERFDDWVQRFSKLARPETPKISRDDDELKRSMARHVA